MRGVLFEFASASHLLDFDGGEEHEFLEFGDDHMRSFGCYGLSEVIGVFSGKSCLKSQAGVLLQVEVKFHAVDEEQRFELFRRSRLIMVLSLFGVSFALGI